MPPLKNSQYTMHDYLKTVENKNLDGVYSFRLSPNTWFIKLQTMAIALRLKSIAESSHFSNHITRMIAFEEGEDMGEVDRHYHVRVETDYKTAQSIRDIIKKAFGSEMKNKLTLAVPQHGGKTQYSVHDCKLKDKKFWKGETYIAKQGNLVYQKGYTEAHVAKMIHWGRKLSSQAGVTIPRKIVLMKDITKGSSVVYIYDSIIQWYTDENKNLPDEKQMMRLIHNIYMLVSNPYRNAVRSDLIMNFSQKLTNYDLQNLI